MMLLIFFGDMLVMAFMIGVIIWLSLQRTRRQLDEASRIPLEDEVRHG
jgi:cbb3-type cytochrome oxidase subunit 3